MLFLVGAANRDDRRYEDGDRFDIHRNDRISTSRSVSAPTSASAPRSPASKAASRSKRSSKRFPEWDVDRDERQALPDLDRARVGDASGLHAVTPSEQTRERRPYDSPVRRQRAAETRERIIAAGAELLHEFAVWNWRALTVRSVAERARRQPAHGLPALRERARAPRRGDGPSRTGVRRRARRARARGHPAPHRADPRVRVVVPARVAHTGRPDPARRAPAPTRRADRRGVGRDRAHGRKPTARSPPRCWTCCGASRPTNASSSTGTSTRRTRSRASPGSSVSSRTPSAGAIAPALTTSTRGSSLPVACLTSASLPRTRLQPA